MFSIGDVVVAKGQAVPMTVVDFINECITQDCETYKTIGCTTAWFDDRSRLHHADFPVDALELESESYGPGQVGGTDA